MVNLWQVDHSRDIKIQEPDDYLEKKTQPTPPPEQPQWVVNLLQPGVIGVMVACIAQSISQLIIQWSPTWRNPFFLFAPILAAFAGYATYRTIQKRLLSSNESLRYQIFELVLIFLLCKLTTHLDNTVQEIVVYAREWFHDPITFFDGETILMAVLALAAWFAAFLTARDLFIITDPTLYVGEKSPMQRITTRFFSGGMILLVTTAFARVQFITVLQSDRPRVPGLILNILIYFLLGLFMLGQLNYTHHTSLWRKERVQLEPQVGTMWLRYSLLFLLVITFIAFLLPTGYTVGLLDLVNFLINIFLLVINLLFFLISYPFLLLLSLLFPGFENEATLPESPMAFERPETPPAATGNGWWEIIKSIVFWIIALVALGYVIRGYLRDRPSLFKAIQKIKPLHWLVSLLKTIGLIFKKVRKSVAESLPQIISRFRRSSTKGRDTSRKHKGSSLRDLIIYNYLKTLDIAKEEGLPRSKHETPYEYNSSVRDKLADGAHRMDSLTDIFVEARYSVHSLNNEKAAQSAEDAKSVQANLRDLQKK